jgi:hypothetical protein
MPSGEHIELPGVEGVVGTEFAALEGVRVLRCGPVEEREDVGGALSEGPCELAKLDQQRGSPVRI